MTLAPHGNGKSSTYRINRQHQDPDVQQYVGYSLTLKDGVCQSAVLGLLTMPSCWKVGVALEAVEELERDQPAGEHNQRRHYGGSESRFAAMHAKDALIEKKGAGFGAGEGYHGGQVQGQRRLMPC